VSTVGQSRQIAIENVTKVYHMGKVEVHALRGVSLEIASGSAIMTLLQSLNRERGITVVLVTHDDKIAHHISRIVRLHDGKVVGQERVQQAITHLTPNPERQETRP
jgi:ABC-type lipoprotein export system ATPase subunit